MNTTRLRTLLRLPLAAVLIAAAVALPGAQRFDGEADPQPAEVDLAVVGGLLIDGHEGPPLPGAVVLVEGNRIVAVGSRDELTVPDGAEVVDARGMTILPGLIDAHVHLDILGHSDYQHWHGRYREGRYAEIMEISTRQLLLSGVTTVVDLAGQPDALGHIQERIASGDIAGPRVVASMGWITNWTDEQVARHHRRSHTVNVRTVAEARAAARTAIAQGAGIIKVHTGLTEGQLRAIRDEAEARASASRATSGRATTCSCGFTRARTASSTCRSAPAPAPPSRPRCSRAWWTGERTSSRP